MTRIDQLVQIPQGDTRRLPFDVDSPDGSDQDLVGASFDWRLGDERDPVLSLSDDGVSIVERDDSAGRFVVELSASATDELTPRVYKEIVTIIDDAGNVTQFVGQVKIRPLEL
jgi:hypothetical protein